MTGYIIGIDPGHGGGDKGATRQSVGWTEADYNMALARDLVSVLRQTGWGYDPVLLRMDEESVSLHERGVKSQFHRCEMVIHIHVNAHYNAELKGGLLFHWPSNAIGACVGDVIARCLPEPLYRRSPRSIPATDHPIPEDDWLQRPRTVMEPHRCTSVLLECGFMSNPDDVAAMEKPEVRDGLVAAVLCGLAEFRRQV
jgi:N-acetylmuramoyl-L-alanine amidase